MKKINRSHRTILLAALALALAAGCADELKPPTAAIALANTAAIGVGTEVVVDGSGSHESGAADDAALALEYAWRIVAAPGGSAAAFVNPALPQATFVPDVPGDYTVGLIVSDGALSSEEATLVVTVAACGGAAPVVDSVVATPAAPNVGDLVALAVAVSDADNAEACGLGQTLTVVSALVGQPAGSAAALAPAAGLDPAFVPDVPGDYTIRTTVTDDTERSAFVDTVVTASTCGNAPPVVDSVVATPAAPNVGDLVALAVAVSDADNAEACGLGQTLTVVSALVGQPAGSAAALAPAAGLDPAFVPDVPGDYTIRTTVTDDTELSSFVDTVVTASTCGNAPPTVDSVVATPAAPNVGDLVALAVAVSDADNADPCGLGQTLTVVSALVGQPAGSAAALAPAAGLDPAFVPDVPGDYTIRTTVTDDTELSSFVDTVVTVADCGDNAPIALIEILSPVADGPGIDVVVATHVVVDDVVALSGAASYDPDTLDPCLLTEHLTYAWSFLEKPAASAAHLNDAALINPSFVPDQPGSYHLQLIVSDGLHAAYAFIDMIADPVSPLATATGFTATFVDGGALWNNPEGIAIGADGAAYVVQNGSNRITRTAAGVTSIFSSGTYLNNAHDIVHYPAADQFFVTSEDFGMLVRLSAAGAQTQWTAWDALNRPRGLTIFTNAAAQVRLVAMDEGNQEIRFYDPAAAPLATSSGFEDFGGLLNWPWGVEARSVSSVNTYFATDPGDGRVYRTNGTTDSTLTSFFDSPRDLAWTPSSDLVVADDNLGFVAIVDNCTTPPCTVTPIAWGDWQPWGVAFETAGSLLVTDRANDALYRITGSF